MYKNKKGITLIALVITIIVLLILAGIAISMLSGENGIINKAVKARNGMDEAKAIECIKLSMTAARTNTNKTDVSEEGLKSELDKYFDNAEVTQTGSNNYVIEIDGKIYKINNGQVTTGYEKETITDGVIAGASEGEKVDYKIYGNSVQGGEPSPDNPVEIQSVGDLVTEGEYKDKYKIPVTVSGKNLISYPYTFLGTDNSGLTVTDNKDGSITINGTASKKVFFHIVKTYGDGSLKLPVGKYTISDNKSDSSAPNFAADIRKNNVDVTYVVANEENNVLTINDTNYDYIWISITIQEGTVFNNVTYRPQLESGSQVTDYELYKQPKTTNIYLNEPLRKVGSYADYIDFKNKKVVRKVIQKTYDGSESWTKSGETIPEGYSQFVTIDNTIVPHYTVQIYITPLSNKFETYSGGYVDKSKERWNVSSPTYNVRPIIKTERLTENTVKAWKSYLSENPVKVCYGLFTQTEETIELPEILTHKGTNIITVNTNIKPSKIEITSYKSTK